MFAERLRPQILVPLVMLLFASCDAPVEPSAEPGGQAPSPEQENAGATTTSNEKGYRVTLRPRDGGVPLNELHAWTIDVATSDGAAFRPTRLAFSGGMPQHQHGFVTEPRVTRALGDGRFLIEGVKFHMAGDWTLRVELVGPDGPDVATFDIAVGP